MDLDVRDDGEWAKKWQKRTLYACKAMYKK